MRVNLKIYGVLRESAAVGDGPFEVEPGTTLGTLLRLIGLVDWPPALLAIVNGHAANMEEPLADGAEVNLLTRISGG